MGVLPMHDGSPLWLTPTVSPQLAHARANGTVLALGLVPRRSFLQKNRTLLK
jgi:hypothetical protein